ncbi:MAG TPA: JAB domain-containing protein [Thermoanaerobaculia bacterium]|nr:JAB domain-containing protein [Thermoanaerobaculia bacterium]
MPALASPDHHAPAASSFPGTCPAPADPLDSLAALSDVEVLGRLLGPRGGELASRALEHAGNLPRLSILSPSHLRSLRLGARATRTLLLASELARRIAYADVPAREVLTVPAAVARYLFLRYARIDQEVFGAVLLDVNNRWIADVEAARGALDRTYVEPRQILSEAIVRGAAGIVLFHNHPSGSPNPSPEDYALTRRFAHAGDIVGIRLLDHLILGSPNSFVSLRERGAW